MNMGYTTDFNGYLNLQYDSLETMEKVAQDINGIAHTRRMARDMSKADFHLDKKIEDYGVEGEFYYKIDESYNEEKDPTIINYNKPPKTQPSLWLQWIITKKEKNKFILEWDQQEKFYEYIKWLKYIINNFFVPNDIKANGKIKWRGEEFEDTGTIYVSNNAIEILY